MIECVGLKDGEVKDALHYFSGVYDRIVLYDNEFTRIMMDDFPMNIYTKTLYINDNNNLTTIDANFFPGEDQYNSIYNLDINGNTNLR